MSTTPPINGQLAKTVSQLGATGALIVISLALVWNTMQPPPPNEDTIQVREEIFRDFSEIKAVLDVHIQQARRDTEAARAILLQICINTADDPAHRSACFDRVERSR